MKIAYLMRQGIESEYILRSYQKLSAKSYIVFETGSIARKAKLLRTFRRVNPIFYPVKVLDIVALLAYAHLWERYIKGKLKIKSIKADLVVEDANEENLIARLKEFKPDMIVVFGTAILREKFLKSVKVPIFNIHTGILPEYRNVHSEFWAYKNKDLENIGTTIIHIDSEIDSGAIALQKRVKFAKNDSLFSLKLKNLKLIPEMLGELVKLHKRKKVPKLKQNAELADFYKTPSILDMIKLVLK